MQVDKNGAVISKVTAAQMSSLGNDYVCMWDDSGLPIHIKVDVIEYLYKGMHPELAKPVEPSNDDIFFQRES